MKKIIHSSKILSQQNVALIIVSTFLLMLIVPLLIGRTQAATLTNTYIRLNRMSSGTATSFRVVFTNITAGTNSVLIDFNGTDTGTSRWTDATKGGLIGATGSQTVSIATCPGETGATGIPGTLTGSSSGSTITVSTSLTMAAATAYCVDLTFASAVTTPTVAGEYHPTVATRTGGTTTDSTGVAVRIITSDQVTVNAIVPPTFNFVLSANTDSFTTNLSTSSVVSTSGTTITITTNAPNGWIVWARDLNNNGSGRGSLRSATASNYNIAGAAAVGTVARTLTVGTEDYGLGVTINTDAAGGGTVSLDAAYNGSGTQAGTLDPTTFRAIASANGTANGDIINLNGRATIAGQTPAASDYTDTITYIGAGRF